MLFSIAQEGNWSSYNCIVNSSRITIFCHYTSLMDTRYFSCPKHTWYDYNYIYSWKKLVISSSMINYIFRIINVQLYPLYKRLNTTIRSLINTYYDREYDEAHYSARKCIWLSLKSVRKGRTTFFWGGYGVKYNLFLIL